MHRIDGPNTLADLPAPLAPGDPGYFKNEAGAGTGTMVTGDWLNAVQEELATVIENAGLVLDKDNSGQLLAALMSLIGPSQWSTGDVKLTYKTVADAGWVFMNDGSIGSAASAATTRAHADTAALFALIWNGTADADAPVSGGRGGSAVADFAANKTLTLPKALGRALAVAGAGAGLTARALGKALGAETHNHGGATGISGAVQVAGDVGVATSHPDHSHAIAADTTLQPTGFLNAMVKL